MLSGCSCPYNCPQIVPSGPSRQEFLTINPYVERLRDEGFGGITCHQEDVTWIGRISHVLTMVCKMY